MLLAAVFADVLNMEKNTYVDKKNDNEVTLGTDK